MLSCVHSCWVCVCAYSYALLLCMNFTPFCPSKLKFSSWVKCSCSVYNLAREIEAMTRTMILINMLISPYLLCFSLGSACNLFFTMSSLSPCFFPIWLDSYKLSSPLSMFRVTVCDTILQCHKHSLLPKCFFCRSMPNRTQQILPVWLKGWGLPGSTSVCVQSVLH